MPIRLLPLLLLTACVTQENYLEKSVKVWCDRQYECNKSAFESAFTDMSDCIDTLIDDGEDDAECFNQECTFDPEAARACLHDQSTASCEDWSSFDFTDDCNDVYTDCDYVDLAVCYAG